MKRILAFALIFTMLFTAMLGIMPAAETDPPALEITRANIELQSTVYLLIEVNYAAAGLESGENVRVDVTNKAGKTITLSPDTISGIATGCVGFKYTKLSAKEIGDDLTIRAYCDDVADDTVTYSILEYAIKAKATSDDTAFIELVEAMIDFGAAAQKAFAYTDAADRVLSEDNSEGFGYGILLCNGEKKIESTSTTVATLVNTTVGINDLYDFYFNKITDTDTVAEGISRYFYFGPSHYSIFAEEGDAGDKSAANKPVYIVPKGYKLPNGSEMSTTNIQALYSDYNAFVAANKEAIINSNLMPLELSSLNFDHITQPFEYTLTHNASASIHLGDSGSEYTRCNGTGNVYYVSYLSKDTLVPKAINARAADIKREYFAVWNLRPGGEYNYTSTLTNNYLFIDSSADSNHLYVCNSNTAKTTQFLKDGKFTLTVSLALGDTAEANMKIGFTSNYNFSNNNYTAPITIDKDGVLSVRNDELVKINSFSDEAPSFTTLHFVFDSNADTVTAYTEDGRVVSSDLVYTGAESLLDVPNFSFLTYGDVYINRITMSKGDLFN